MLSQRDCYLGRTDKCFGMVPSCDILAFTDAVDRRGGLDVMARRVGCGLRRIVLLYSANEQVHCFLCHIFLELDPIAEVNKCGMPGVISP